MPGLYHTLGVGSESLFAARQGVDTAGHNISNAQVEGYSRQRVNLEQRPPSQRRNLLIGNGAYVGGITRAHDKFIEEQINRAHQDSGFAEAHAESMQALEPIFSPEFRAGISDEMTEFFNGLQELSTFPEDYTVRTNVVEQARNLTQSFRRIDSRLGDQRLALNEKVQQTASSVSDKLKELANLNTKIKVLEAGDSMNANDLRDQRDKLLRDLTKQIDVSYYEDQHGMVHVKGPDEVTLVDRGHAASVEVRPAKDNEGLYGVVVKGWEGNWTEDVTDDMSGGALDAYIKTRDKVIPELSAHNDEMAYKLATEFNKVHKNGYGLKEFAESTGRNFFKQPDQMDGAAGQIALSSSIDQSPDAIAAASSPLAPGDNVNLNKLLRIQDQKMFGKGSASLNEFYANYTGRLGLEVVRAENVKEASDIMVKDLHKRRDAVAGVSMDEEAMNLMKWQSNFTASSKLITTVDEMLETVLSLKR